LLKKKTRIIQIKTLENMAVRMKLERVGGGPIANADIIMYAVGSNTPFIRKTDENGCFSKKKNQLSNIIKVEFRGNEEFERCVAYI
jgi:hypothetical protein